MVPVRIILLLFFDLWPWFRSENRFTNKNQADFLLPTSSASEEMADV